MIRATSISRYVLSFSRFVLSVWWIWIDSRTTSTIWLSALSASAELSFPTARISRPFEELVAATFGKHHQYPDGFALFTGTLFAPTQDRDEPGQGFTQQLGDVVTIRSSHLGALVNWVGSAEELPEWSFGLRQLFDYLHDQRLVQESALTA
ncbi:hypothetical protein ACVWZ8_003383 [Arthrobacter sp. UYCu723]